MYVCMYVLHTRACVRHQVMVGDGVTDLEARDDGSGDGGADVFVGYGGVVERPAVRAGADWYVHDFGQMVELLQGSCVQEGAGLGAGGEGWREHRDCGCKR